MRLSIARIVIPTLLCGALAAHAVSTPVTAESTPAQPEATALARDSAACRQKLERLFAEMESLMARTPHSIETYREVLVRYFVFPHGPSSSQIGPDADTVNCATQDIVTIVTRSRFLFGIRWLPNDRGMHIELRNDVMKVYVDAINGGILQIGAWPIHPYP